MTVKMLEPFETSTYLGSATIRDLMKRATRSGPAEQEFSQCARVDALSPPVFLGGARHPSLKHTGAVLAA